MNKTIQALKDEMLNAPKIKAKLIENISIRENPKIVTNLFSVEYDFVNETISIYYYVEDREYPDQIISFTDFIGLFKDLQ